MANDHIANDGKKVRLIDANALMEKSYFSGKLPDPGNLYPDGKEVVDVDDIDNAPTIDAVEVVHGLWIWSENGELDYEQYWLCSECGDNTFFKTNYCPHCGAKMDGDGK